MQVGEPVRTGSGDNGRRGKVEGDLRLLGANCGRLLRYAFLLITLGIFELLWPLRFRFSALPVALTGLLFWLAIASGLWYVITA